MRNVYTIIAASHQNVAMRFDKKLQVRAEDGTIGRGFRSGLADNNDIAVRINAMPIPQLTNHTKKTNSLLYFKSNEFDWSSILAARPWENDNGKGINRKIAYTT